LVKNCSGKIEIVGKKRSGMIKIGFGEVGIFDKKRSRSILKLSGKIIFCGNAKIGHGSKLNIASDGVLKIGDGFTATAETSVICYKKITFGNNCLVSWDTLFMDSDIHKIMDKDGNVLNHPKEIKIGDHVWIGCRCLILKGAQIGDGNVIGANTTVAGGLEGSNSVYIGNHAKCIHEDISWTP
jgi:acetyltransferase-like isoleucine patch superfamily enzyme